MVAYAFLKNDNDKEKVINDYIQDTTRFDNNPLDFYKYEIKKISFIAEKMYRKVSKLYDLLPPPVEDGSGNIPLNKSK
jgi:predicted solute-binding protein